MCHHTQLPHLATGLSFLSCVKPEEDLQGFSPYTTTHTVKTGHHRRSTLTLVLETRMILKTFENDKSRISWKRNAKHIMKQK